ncbi:hypothetical protein Nepgr_030320 [Nepenthes gracilis]|uniref:CRAL-TRIO domain-containing protein n=1 Tax=Nepenthes gracilis TaxID=150966 RepID=A0AAD3TFJ5_NEPGR|nr:hypothetical protein Nepgr_030320 [Nepenthes gracilis]
MGKKERHREIQTAVEAVLDLVRKQGPLTLKQENFCIAACVERFLKEKGFSVKKSAEQLRSCLSWRGTIGADNLIADEFSAELAEGIAYVAGHDNEYRPVMVFRFKQDYQKFHSQKSFIRLLVFTLVVAIQTMLIRTSNNLFSSLTEPALSVTGKGKRSGYSMSIFRRKSFAGRSTCNSSENLSNCPECPCEVDAGI